MPKKMKLTMNDVGMTALNSQLNEVELSSFKVS